MVTPFDQSMLRKQDQANWLDALSRFFLLSALSSFLMLPMVILPWVAGVLFVTQGFVGLCSLDREPKSEEINQMSAQGKRNLYENRARHNFNMVGMIVLATIMIGVYVLPTMAVSTVGVVLCMLVLSSYHAYAFLSNDNQMRNVRIPLPVGIPMPDYQAHLHAVPVPAPTVAQHVGYDRVPTQEEEVAQSEPVEIEPSRIIQALTLTGLSPSPQ